MLKSILILEKGIIPPNALFEKLNPKLRAERNNIQVSQLLSIVSIYLLNIKGS